ncbi:contactin-associated protein-like 2 [Eudromia elegans]
MQDGHAHLLEIRNFGRDESCVTDAPSVHTNQSRFPVQMNDSDPSLFQHSFQGCMQFIHVDDQLVDLQAVEQGKLGSFANVTIDMCAIIDRCVPNHCEHGGRCTQTWDSFKCTCDGTGYSGATCHNSIFELSCEAYKHLGKTSNNYWIDPDGSGALGPLKVYCNMTEHSLDIETYVVLQLGVGFMLYLTWLRTGLDPKNPPKIPREQTPEQVLRGLQLLGEEENATV